MLWLRSFVAGLSARRHRFDARSVSPYEICDGQSGNGTGFSRGTSICPRLYNSTNAPSSSSPKCCSYQKGKRAKPVNLPKKGAFSEIEEHWIRNSRFINARFVRLSWPLICVLLFFDVMLCSLVFTDVSNKHTAPSSA
jgi:hypothetical protein